MKTITTLLLILCPLLFAVPRHVGAADLERSPAAPSGATQSVRAGTPRSTPQAGRSAADRNWLAPRSADPGSAGQTGRSRSGGASVLTALSALAIVVGLFLTVAWLAKRKLPAAGRTLPVEVLEVLGRAPLATRQDVHLIRLGKKLVLVSLSSAGAETLTEIADADEVDRLAGLCKQAMPRSATTSFRHVLQSFSREPAVPSFVGGDLRSGTRSTRRTTQVERPLHG